MIRYLCELVFALLIALFVLNRTAKSQQLFPLCKSQSVNAVGGNWSIVLKNEEGETIKKATVMMEPPIVISRQSSREAQGRKKIAVDPNGQWTAVYLDETLRVRELSLTGRELKLGHAYGIGGRWGASSTVNFDGDIGKGVWTYKGDTNGSEEWTRLRPSIDKVEFGPLRSSEEGDLDKPAVSTASYGTMVQVRGQYEEKTWGSGNNFPHKRPKFYLKVYGKNLGGYHLAAIPDSKSLIVHRSTAIYGSGGTSFKDQVGIAFVVYLWPGLSNGEKNLCLDDLKIPFDLQINGLLLGTAQAMIKRHTSITGLDEGKLAKDLLNSDPKTAAKVLRTLERVDRDDVAFEFLTKASKEQMENLAETKEGRELLTLMLAELADGWAEDEEEVVRDMALKYLPNDRPPISKEDTERQSKVNALKESAKSKIKDHTNLIGNLNEEALGKSILDAFKESPSLGEAVLNELDSYNTDDVSLEFMEQADDKQLQEIAENDDGRALLMRMVREMYAGDMADDERKQMQRAMGAVGDAMLKKMPKDVDVEVLTFLHGGALDIAGQPFGSKGHTAVVVGDLVYSFESGWSAGRTRSEYMADNSWRPGVGQVLKLPRSDVAKVLKNLNSNVGTGTYAISGDICTDASASMLQVALPKLKLTADWNPQRFVGDLHDQAPIKRHNFYPKTDDKE